MFIKALIGVWLCAALAGCSVYNLPVAQMQVSAKRANPTGEQAPSQTFSEILQTHASSKLAGEVIAQLPDGYRPQPELRHYAFSPEKNRLVYVFDTSARQTRVVLLTADLHAEKTLDFADFPLGHAVLSGRILYLENPGRYALKLNTISGDYSKVSLSEMNEVSALLAVKNLHPGEASLDQVGGYIYTDKGTVFDVKQQDYVPQYKLPGSAYPHAELADRNLLYAINPRADGSAVLNWYEIQSGGNIRTGNPVLLRLDLAVGTPMQEAEYAMNDNGDAYLFEIGVPLQGQTVVEAFHIPLGDYRAESIDLAAK